VQIIALRTLQLFWVKHPQAEAPLRAWHSAAAKAEWRTPQDIKDQFGGVDFVRDNRAISNIGSNKFRLVVHVSYTFKRVLVKFIGTHAEYDEIDAATV